jgi:hypothetical protein
VHIVTTSLGARGDLNARSRGALLNPSLYFRFEPGDAALPEPNRLRGIAVADELIPARGFQTNARENLRESKKYCSHCGLSKCRANKCGKLLGNTMQC